MPPHEDFNMTETPSSLPDQDLHQQHQMQTAVDDLFLSPKVMDSTSIATQVTEELGDTFVATMKRNENNCNQQQQQQQVDAIAPLNVDTAGTDSATVTPTITPTTTTTTTTTTRSSTSPKIKYSTFNPNAKPLEFMRKAGVAMAGGTLVVVGAIMIPLPTPFGAVVAGSGMAVLGSEFESANKVNQQIVHKAKESVDYARTKLATRIVETAQNMEVQDDTPTDNGTDNDSHTGDETSDDGSDTISEQIKDDNQVAAEDGQGESSSRDVGDNTNNNNSSSSSKASDTVEDHDAVTNNPPSILNVTDAEIEESPQNTEDALRVTFMNPKEQQRQDRLTAQRQKQEDRQNETAFVRANRYFRNRTATFLTGTLLPFVQNKQGDETTTTTTSEANEEEGQEMELLTEHTTTTTTEVDADVSLLDEQT